MPVDALTTRRLQSGSSSAEEIVVASLPGSVPGVIFLHGMNSSRIGAKSESLLARSQARGMGFTCFDFRAHGESGGKLELLTFSQLVEDATAVTLEVGPAILVGSSMGALAAAWTAAQQPEKVLALVLLSPALGFLENMAQASGSFKLHPDDEQAVEFSDEALRDAGQFDESALPALLTMPTCVVHGSHDTTVPSHLSRALCEAIPHADKELWIIEQGSHSLNEVLEPTLDRVEAFLDQRGLIPARRPTL